MQAILFLLNDQLMAVLQLSQICTQQFSIVPESHSSSMLPAYCLSHSQYTSAKFASISSIPHLYQTYSSASNIHHQTLGGSMENLQL